MPKKVTLLRGEEFIRNIAQKIRNVGDNILDVMKRAGGHTLERHVGMSNDELILRAMRGEVEAASSFPNKSTAVKAIQENLRHNAEEIAQWLGKNPSLKDQMVIEFSHKYSIGIGVPGRSKIPLYGLTKSRLVLRPDPTNELGFKIVTAFPIM